MYEKIEKYINSKDWSEKTKRETLEEVERDPRGWLIRSHLSMLLGGHVVEGIAQFLVNRQVTIDDIAKCMHELQDNGNINSSIQVKDVINDHFKDCLQILFMNGVKRAARNDDNEALLRCTKNYLRYEIENKNPNFQCRYCSHFPSPEDIDNVSVRLNEKGGLEIHLNICKTHSHKI